MTCFVITLNDARHELRKNVWKIGSGHFLQFALHVKRAAGDCPSQNIQARGRHRLARHESSGYFPGVFLHGLTDIYHCFPVSPLASLSRARRLICFLFHRPCAGSAASAYHCVRKLQLLQPADVDPLPVSAGRPACSLLATQGKHDQQHQWYNKHTDKHAQASNLEDVRQK